MCIGGIPTNKFVPTKLINYHPKHIKLKGKEFIKSSFCDLPNRMHSTSRETIPQPSLTPHLKRDVNIGKGECNILLVGEVNIHRALF